MICTTTKTGTFKSVNSAFSEGLGYSQKELLSMSFFDLIHPEDIAPTESKMGSLHSDDSKIICTNRYRTKNGSYKFFQWEMTCSTDGIYLAVAHDITEHMIAEEALNQYKHIVYSSTDMIAFIDKQYNLIAVNEAFSKAFNLTPEDCIGKQLVSVFGKDMFNHSIKPLASKCLEGKEIKQENWRHYPAYGRQYVEAAHYPYRNHENEIMGCVVYVRNRTAQKLAQDALNDERRRLESIIDGANIGTWEWNVQTGETIYNQKWAQILGYTIDELAPLSVKTWENLAHPDDLKQSGDLLKRHFSGELPYYDLECRMKHKNGSWVAIHDRGKVVTRTADGKPLMMYGTHSNITERKQIEEERQRLQKIESLGILAGGIAHDFNNLLAGIYGYIQLAMLETKEEKVKNYLARSLSSTDRSQSLTQELLTFAKGGSPIKRIAKLFPLIKDAAQMALNGSAISSRFLIDENLWSCNYDKNQITQVIDNITINAIQAMPNGGMIEYSARNIVLTRKENHSLAAGNYVKISICDNGIGMSSEILPRIFDPYYTTKSKSNGLGLASCFSIIKRHNGCIDVESTLEEGSTFHIYLPAFTENYTEKPEKSKKVSYSEDKTILVMDDEELIREVIKEQLETLGYTVVLTENGNEAIDFFKAETAANRKLAGMIFDLTVPGGMGGKEAIRKIREICLDTPAFVASGYSTDPIMANPEGYGFNASISKPFMVQDLTEMLEKHLKRV
jgi:PAS domain S-box-containing protein